MKRSEAEEVARELLKLYPYLGKFLTLGGLVTAQRPPEGWEDEPESPLPKRLYLTLGTRLNADYGQGVVCLIAEVPAAFSGVEIDRSIAVLEAACAAYNRQRVEDEIDVETEKVLGDFEEKLQRVAAEELQAQIDKAVKEEREKREECEEALHRLAREARVPDEGPAEIVEAVLELLGTGAQSLAKLAAEERRREEAEEVLREIEVALNRPVSLGRREIASEAIKDIRLAATVFGQRDPSPWGEPFIDARAALKKVQASLEEARRHGIASGSFTTKIGAVEVDLEWPWRGGYPAADYDFRFYVEGRFNLRPAESKK